MSESKTIEQKKGVLIVDDNRITTKLLSRYILAFGYVPFEAHDGCECLDKLELLKNMVDVVILDVMMPRMGGLECVKIIRSRGSDIPVLMAATSHLDIPGHIDALNAGADDWLQKPVEEEILRGKLKLLLRLGRK